MKHTKLILCALAILPLTATPSEAQEHRRHDRGIGHRHGPGWRGDIGRFHEHDARLWRGGRWVNGRHGGRLGWWWVVAGTWYFYPYPVYPYPDPYQPPVIVQQPAPPQYWYYCADPAGYYPYVAQCRVNWQQVPASPPPAGVYPAPPP